MLRNWAFKPISFKSAGYLKASLRIVWLVIRLQFNDALLTIVKSVARLGITLRNKRFRITA
jgi:hypothetical protein